jgi:transcription initiation factor TFIIE subunit alpha
MTRNMLYRLYDHNLVSFMRKKDKEKGWYIYYWTFNLKRIKYLAADLQKKRLEKLQERLHREQTTQFYSCEDNCIRLSFDQATDFEYKCPECGKLLNQEDNAAKIESIKAEIAGLEKALVPVKEKSRVSKKEARPAKATKSKSVKKPQKKKSKK